MPTTRSLVSGGAWTLPRLVTVEEASTLLAVDKQTVYNWADADVIPYIELPLQGGGRRRIRIPLQGLLNTLGGNWNLALELEELMAETPGATTLKELLAADRSNRLPHTGEGPTQVDSDNPSDDLWNLAQARGPQGRSGR
jgi:excisionase family DNA binding protein